MGEGIKSDPFALSLSWPNPAKEKAIRVKTAVNTKLRFLILITKPPFFNG
jgi:hypothetical protein